ncbi:MAG TPA: Nramp family divalent metal transporter [Chloroflexota bacterium]|nr:Nramp family divalent metal transporter [Chloroflexota bacterium]
MALKDIRRSPVFQWLAYPWITVRDQIRQKLPSGIPLATFFAILGPGMVAATAGNDAGGIATYASVGASYGYDLLWMLALSTVSLIIVQEMCARMGAVTGKGLSELIREQFGPRWTVFAMLTLLLANGLTTVSEFAGIAASFELAGISRYFTVPISAMLIWWLVARGSYQKVERVALLMTLVFFAYPISAVLAHPDWGVVVQRTLIPSFHADSAYIFIFVATVGTTITPYMQIFVQSSVVDKGITAREYPYERAEVILGSIFSNVVALFIIVATAATLFVHHITINTAADAALALVPLAGRFAGLLFGIGLLGASLLAAGVLPLATAFSITEAFGWEKGISLDPHEAPAFYYLFTALIVIGAGVTLLPNLPLIQLLLIVQVINGLLLPALLIFIVQLASDPSVMGSYRNGAGFNVLAWGTVIVVGGLAIVLLLATVVGPAFGLSLPG